MESHYEIRADGKGIDVKGFSKLFESRELAESIETREGVELEQSEPETDGE